MEPRVNEYKSLLLMGLVIAALLGGAWLAYRRHQGTAQLAARTPAGEGVTREEEIYCVRAGGAVLRLGRVPGSGYGIRRYGTWEDRRIGSSARRAARNAEFAAGVGLTSEQVEKLRRLNLPRSYAAEQVTRIMSAFQAYRDAGPAERPAAEKELLARVREAGVAAESDAAFEHKVAEVRRIVTPKQLQLLIFPSMGDTRPKPSSAPASSSQPR